MICNHHCRLDWLYLWPVVMRHGRCASLHVTLKDSLRSAPFFGWAMQAFLFIFLRRTDREADRHQCRAFRHGQSPQALPKRSNWLGEIKCVFTLVVQKRGAL